MSELFETLRPHLERRFALENALTLYGWDNETLAPKEAMENTAKIIGTLSAEAYRALVNDEVRSLLEALSMPKEFDALTIMEQCIVKKLSKNLKRLEKIPADEFRAFSELTAKAGSIWAKAKEDNDFSAFAPTLKEIVSYQKKFAAYTKKPEISLYDAMLDENEEGILTRELDIFFEKIKEDVIPLLKKVVAVNDTVDKEYNYQKFPIDKQKEFCRFLAEYIGFDFARGVMAESAHPFTTNLHNHDVRITNHFHENNLESAMFSVIHEGGHALYELGVDDSLTLTAVGGGTSMGVHESQSRFYENVLGRSEAFWKPIYEKLQNTYPEALSDIELSQFIRGINKAEPGPVRTEADELTYPLHIIIRYEIEKMLMEDLISVDELPRVWNEKYEEYLGIAPKNDAEGVLQDVHWSGGAFGYFPSYAIGNAVAAQIYAYMHNEVNVKECLENGNLMPIREYLREHIHCFGSTKNMNELLIAMTGEPLNAEYYTKYLTEKYTKLYLE